ncbi:hypothetical protein A2108_01590 [Candidatus Wolfebacteria bacterium GWA1_42_9]|uniref:Uncharacterized protein n=1 Tax=Candidatus Wolfebacteria bacterium GWA1_42_9 TaxID=1802553 RepID=A0A1F8DN50_9BACT|nr:MAG: hypothetical protein A2108_01590 [Candidatus Wolfebacteria bacterium GWA1_42_9]
MRVIVARSDSEILVFQAGDKNEPAGLNAYFKDGGRDLDAYDFEMVELPLIINSRNNFEADRYLTTPVNLDESAQIA